MRTSARLWLSVTGCLLLLCLCGLSEETDNEKAQPQVVEVIGQRLRLGLAATEAGAWPRLHASDGIWQPAEGLPFVSLTLRGPCGVQQDLSVLGGTFEQTSLRLEGIDISDPQTGHHDLDIGLIPAEVEYIEMDAAGKGFGGGGLSGTLNVGLQVPQGSELTFMAGEHGLLRAYGHWGGASATPKSKIKIGGGLDYAESDGWRQGTDFEVLSLSFSALSQSADSSTLCRLAVSRRAFGAQDFYAPYPSFETTDSQMLLLKYSAYLNNGAGTNDLYLLFKRHGDEYILDRYNPGLYIGEHVSWLSAAGGNAGLGVANLTYEFRGERLSSTTLGEKSRQVYHFGLVSPGDNDWQDVRVAGGVDVTEGNAEYTLSAAARSSLDPEGTRKISLSVARTYRLPSMTELYYWSPANQGNPNLSAERAQQALLSMDAGRSAVYLFRRRTSDVIDWIRFNPTDPWQATNIGTQTASGAGFNLSLDTDRNRLRAYLEYMDTDTPPVAYQSKYALRYMELKAGLKGSAAFCGRRIGLEYGLETRRRKGWDKTILLADVALWWQAGSARLKLGATNLLDESYEDVPGATAPGRWLYAGAQIEW